MEENNEKVFILQPLGKWKRILLSLGDYFIAFIISFILFNLAIFPLAKIIFNTEVKNREAETVEVLANNLLVTNGIIISKSESKKLEEHVNYTFKCFLSYYAFDEENPTGAASYPDYGHKQNNEVIRHYYVDIKNDSAKYISIFKEVNTDGMFTIGDTVDSVVLKNEYKNLLANELLEVTDEEKYSTNMLNFRDNVFARLFYLNVYQDILNNDYVKDGLSYLGLLNKVKSIMSSLQWVATGATLVSIIISWAGVYLIYPLINPDRRTATMSIMQLDKLRMGSMSYITRKNVWIQSFYYLILALSSSIVMPMLFFGVAYTFKLPLLFIITSISLILAFASLFFILFNQYNRSGSDILTYTVVVPTSELDRMYREKNNG